MYTCMYTYLYDTTCVVPVQVHVNFGAHAYEIVGQFCAYRTCTVDYTVHLCVCTHVYYDRLFLRTVHHCMELSVKYMYMALHACTCTCNVCTVCSLYVHVHVQYMQWNLSLISAHVHVALYM